ncbi:GntR family transcriptional regulator [Leucobacter luti]|uniref:GntR family transcriptional regulator n=1 Tax=Leucobacter luti TaxID=340320 RepID=A0A4R6RSU5_9MICO|nr:GntR family transcriptional regulator [Leucobacter luti]TDP89824.1 GntR family transcriptional regulator [Leucobacter luti]
MSEVRSNVRGAEAPVRELRYQRVYDLVLRLIEENGLRPGDKLPSTAELTKLADVSVISVRRALDELDHDGVIERHQGVGTFVAEPKLVSEPGRSGALLGTISDDARTVAFETRLVGLSVGMPGLNHVRALNIQEGQPVWEISRVRLRGGRLTVAERATIPLSLVPAIDEEQLADGSSLYELLAQRYGIVEAYAEQVFQVDRPSQWEREQLELSPTDVVMRVRGVSYTEDDVAFDSYQQTYRADEYVFYVQGRRSDSQLVRPGAGGSWAVRSLGSAQPPAAAAAE